MMRTSESGHWEYGPQRSGIFPASYVQRLHFIIVTSSNRFASYIFHGFNLEPRILKKMRGFFCECGTKARLRQVETQSRFSLLFAHDLFGKPVSTFPDHALTGFANN